MPPKPYSSRTSKSNRKEAAPIEFKVVDPGIRSVALLADGKHFVSGDKNGKIRCRGIEDGEEAGRPMDAGSAVRSIAVSQDGKWIVAGTSCKMIVWDAKSRKKVNEFEHKHGLLGLTTLDVSPDGTKIASGLLSDTGAAVVWSLSTGQNLFEWEHFSVWTVKFSCDSHLIATGGQCDSSHSLRIYDNQNGRLLVKVQFRAYSVAWASDSKQLFALSPSGEILCLDVSTGKTLFEWSIPVGAGSKFKDMSLSMSAHDTFIICCANEVLSFWDPATCQQLNSVIRLPYSAKSVATSARYDLVIGGEQGIILYNLREILPSSYVNGQKKRERDSIRSLRTQNERSNERIADLEKTIQQLRTQLVDSQRASKEREDNLEKIIKSLCKDISTVQSSSDEKAADFENTSKQLRTKLIDSTHTAKVKEDGLKEAIDALRANLAIQNTRSNEKVKDLEATIERLHTQFADSRRSAEDDLRRLRTELADSQQRASGLTDILRTHQRKHQCEVSFDDGRVVDAAKVLLEVRESVSDYTRSDMAIMDWLPAFTSKCIVELEKIGDRASGTDKRDNALTAYATALSLSPLIPNALLTKWASTVLLHGWTKEVMDSAKECKLPSVIIYRAICDTLERNGHAEEAIECFRQMQNDLTSYSGVQSEHIKWGLDFLQRCTQGLEKLVNAQMHSQNYTKADRLLSTMLSLDGVDRVDTLLKRSKARVMMKSWEDALKDADEVIELDPSSPLGYEQRRAALHGMRHFAEAVIAFDAALLKLKESPQHNRELCQYVDARPKIHEIINETISNMPLELIDTKSGHLLDRRKQAEVFESDSIFHELISSMTTKIDIPHIRREVKRFYRYVMLSHRWQLVEPRYQDLKNSKVPDLKTSFSKLKAFCKLVYTLGFQWAWCDTCCVDQDNTVVLQESLVAMFTWYRGSTLTIVYLHDVPSGSFSESEWNRRAWTYQEYVAAETVRFYTRDWEPYLKVELWNHKKSPDIISEMQRISQITAAQMSVIRPGRDRVREKLFLASKRLSTRVEDIAYSLLGIFGVSIPVIYGEGTRAVGRFLEHILKGSGDLTILAWSGTANDYNSCLPLNLTVYDSLEPPHIPHMEMARLEDEVSKLSSSIPGLNVLFEALNGFSSPSNSTSLDSGRLRLHCISFPISELTVSLEPDMETNLQEYHAMTPVFGEIKIKTTSKLTIENEHSVVHPWIPLLLGQEYLRRSTGLDDTEKALRLVVRLRQPFGALLLEKVSWIDYKRVAADSLIRVQIPEDAPLVDLVNNIKTIFVQ